MFYYNPWKKESKQPFGAIKNQSAMRVVFETDEMVAVKLVIHRDFGARHEFDLTSDGDGRYTTTVTFDHGRALYFYHFELIDRADWGLRRRFYGATKAGGEGVMLENEADVLNFQVSVYEGDDETPAWYQDSVFYQIFPDRFYNGNKDKQVNAPKINSFLYATPDDDPLYVRDPAGDIVRWDFYGGNLRGIIEKIPYLQDLGVNALYLNPIFLARSNHRYDTSDYLKIDPMLGTEDDFRELIELLHAARMRLVLDGVFSHVGQDSLYFNTFGNFGENEGAAKSKESPYFDWFKFNEWPHDYKSWWGIKDLPEVDKDNASFRAFIYGKDDSVLSKWNDFGVDGWRLDVADELPDDFIRGIRAKLEEASEKVLIGEVWEDASNKLSYERRRDYILGAALQGVMNYPLREAIINYVDGNISAQDFAYRLTTLQENYPQAIFYGNLNNIGTHDSERILTMVGDEHMEMAVGLMFVMPGVPCIYYGDEAGLTGRKDPSNRKFFPWEEIHTPFHRLYTRWAHERRRNEALKTGEFAIGYLGSVLAILRHKNDETYLYLTNPTEQAASVHAEKIEFLRNQDFIQKLSALTDIELPAKSDWFGKVN